ncbi:MAG: NAD-binding protein [Rhodothermales bacterium]|nr:NAD-binding protein [Rhodothermales bacterium]
MVRLFRLVLAFAGLAGLGVLPVAAQAVPSVMPEGFWTGPVAFDVPLLVLVAALAVWSAGLAAQRLGASAALGELVLGLAVGAMWPRLDVGDWLPLLAAVGFAALMLTAGLQGGQRSGRGERPSVALVAGALGGPLVLVVVALAVLWPDAGVLGVPLVAVALAAGVVGLRPRDARLPHVAALSTLPLVLGVLALSDSMAALAGRLVGLAVLAALALAARWGIVRMRGRLRGLGRTTLFSLMLVAAALHAAVAVLVGWPAALGAGLAGYSLGRALRGTPQADELATLVRHAGPHVAAPFLFAWLGFAAGRVAHADGLGLGTLVLAGVGLAVVAIGGRFAGLLAVRRAAHLSQTQAVELGWSLVPRGGVTAYLLLAGLTASVVSPALFGAATLAVLASLVLDPLAARLAARLASESAGRDDAREGVVLVGAGPLARRLALVLDGPVTLLDRNARNVDAAEAGGLRVVTASALDADALRDAGTATARFFVALTGNPQLNRAAADIARTSFGVPYTLVPDLSGRPDADGPGDTLFGDGIDLGDWEYHVSRGHVRLDETPYDPSRPVVPTADRLPLAIRRRGTVIPFFRGAGYEDGDRLIALVRTDGEANPARDRFEALVRTARVLDLDGPMPMVMFFDRVGHVVAERLGIEPERLSVLLMQREADSGSVVLPGLAIPHAVVPGTGRFEMVIARIRGEGAQFPNQPQPVHAAFVLVSTADERTFHLQALAGVAHAVQRDGFEEAWMAAAGPDELRALVLNR